MKNTIRILTYINRFNMFVSTLFFMILILESKRNIRGEDFAFALITGLIHIISSVILLLFIRRYENKLKSGLISYQIIVVFYFLIVPGMSSVIAIMIPALLAVGLTVVLELLYKQTKKSISNNTNEDINNIGK